MSDLLLVLPRVAGLMGFGDLNRSANEVKYPSIYSTATGIMHDCPTDYGVLITVSSKGWYAYLQVFMPTRSGLPVYFRLMAGTEWQGWKTV